MPIIIVYLWIVLLLSSCSLAPLKFNKKLSENHVKFYESHSQALVALTHWNAHGQIAVHNGNEARSAQVYWEQRGANYNMQLFGPFPGGSLKIHSQSGLVKLSQGSGYIAHFQEHTVWSIPIDEMLYWIKGMPAPNSPAETTWDRDQHLVKLDQSGWQILYSHYTSNQGIDLPRKIEAHNPPLKIKIIVNDWQLLT